jgi:D-alanyl-D-alanine carboxypeptidase/D-alanyl-D-alanine-endopeptidase (penicillin-binding protein 4)
MQDGSGLARKNLITPYGTAALLKFMSNHSYADYFFDSLPIGGVDGTLKSRMKGMSAAGKVHAKTGYVGYARNLSGYVYSQDDERFIFSILVNNYTVPTPAINLLQDRICNTIAEFKR